MPKMPKSSTPRAFRTKRVVYRETNIVMPIFIYRKPVFLITLETVFMERRKKKSWGNAGEQILRKEVFQTGK